MSSARSLPPGRTWPRVVVVLLALLLPGVPAGTGATPPVAAAEIAEYDVLDTAVRPASYASHRTVAPPPRPASRTAPVPGVPRSRPLPVPPGPAYAPDSLRTVVLRC
ncbi:hypothetical protein ACH4F6_24620 [Streptomyces sp. NPDC017936]|uniref:hypothetical protein n=1 Tax=Streptomyces sp. NPDC017936 TaxID=3365016 RepID=UPI00379F8DDB